MYIYISKIYLLFNLDTELKCNSVQAKYKENSDINIGLSIVLRHHPNTNFGVPANKTEQRLNFELKVYVLLNYISHKVLILNNIKDFNHLPVPRPAIA